MTLLPVYCHPRPYEAFCQAVAVLDTSEGLLQAAFAVAVHEDTEASISDVESAIERLSATVRRRSASGTPAARLAHLHDVLFEVARFRGNEADFYNPANGYLNRVLKTQLGIPTTLTLVYKLVAERVGLQVCGINTPGHFLAAVTMPSSELPQTLPAAEKYAEQLLVDPFYSGRVLTRDEVFARVALATGKPIDPLTIEFDEARHSDWVRRIIHHLQAIFSHAGRDRDCHAMQELQDVLTQSERVASRVQ